MSLADTPIAEAGRAAVHSRLRELTAALERARSKGDEKSIHHARVASRRIRSALAVLEVVLGRSARKPGRQLRALGRALGEVRDLDVLIAAQHEAKIDDRAAHRSREVRQTELGLAIESRRTRKLLARLGHIARARTEGPRRPGEPTMLVRDFAGSWLLRGCEAVQAYGRGLAIEPPTTLHRLRIEVKRLRYSVELFGDALDPRGRDPLVELLVNAQDHLGAIHDAAAILARHPSESGERALAELQAKTPQTLQELMSPRFRERLMALVLAF